MAKEYSDDKIWEYGEKYGLQECLRYIERLKDRNREELSKAANNTPAGCVVSLSMMSLLYLIGPLIPGVVLAHFLGIKSSGGSFRDGVIWIILGDAVIIAIKLIVRGIKGGSDGRLREEAVKACQRQDECLARTDTTLRFMDGLIAALSNRDLKAEDFRSLDDFLNGLSSEERQRVSREIILPIVSQQKNAAIDALVHGTRANMFVCARALSMLMGIDKSADYAALYRQAVSIRDTVLRGGSPALSDTYGRRNEKWFERVKSFGVKDSDSVFDEFARRYSNFPSSPSYETIRSRLLMNDGSGGEAITKLLLFVWHYATKSPYDASRFNKALEIYNHYAGISHQDQYGKKAGILPLDSLLATIHKNSSFGAGMLDQMSGMITGWYDHFIKKGDSAALSNFASGLMWLNDIKHEHELLRKMAVANITMSEDIRDRLTTLERGPAPTARNAPRPKDAQTHPILGNAGIFAFDGEPSSWPDDQLQLFFDVLGDRVHYALSMDLWEPGVGRNMTLAPDTPWDDDIAFDGIIEAVMLAFGNEVSCDRISAALLLPQNHEMLDGVLLRFGGGRIGFGRSAIFVNVFKMRTRLEVRIYTLYEPQGSASDDKANALALRRSVRGSQGANPKQTAYIKEIRDVVTNAIERIANEDEDGPLY